MRTPTRATATQTTATARAGAALERCLGPADAGVFLRDQWERTPAHVPREEPDRFAQLLTRADAERMLTATGIRMPGFRLVKAGEQLRRICPRHSVAAAAVHGRHRRASRPRRVRGRGDDRAPGAARHARAGRRLRPASSSSSWATRCRSTPTTRRARRRGCRCTTTPTTSSSSRSPARSGGSSTSPCSSCPSRRSATRRRSATPGAVVLDVTLCPGDTLYLPRGWLHEAVTSETDSLHLTVGVNVITWQQAIRDALDETGDDIAMRRSIEAGSLDEALRVLAERLEPGRRRAAPGREARAAGPAPARGRLRPAAGARRPRPRDAARATACTRAPARRRRGRARPRARRRRPAAARRTFATRSRRCSSPRAPSRPPSSRGRSTTRGGSRSSRALCARASSGSARTSSAA